MRRRILQSTLLVVMITALVLGGPLAITTWQLVEDFTRADLTSRLERVAGRLDETVDASAIELAVPSGGRLVMEEPGRSPRAIGVDVGADPVAETLPFGPGGAIRLEQPRSVMRTQQVEVTFVVLLLVVLSVGAGAVVATLTARRLAEPLSDVADRAARLGAGDFRSAPDRHGIPELDRVSDVLDTSAAALAALVQRERELVGDVSHQLRSRLTALQLRLDELATHPDPSARREALAALEQAERLAGVLDELLEAARAARAAGAEVVDLRAGLTGVADEWRPALRAAGRSFKVRVPDGLLARVTPARIREAVGALVDNALQHGGGTVTLSARVTENTIVVEVADAGAGVPEELVAHVFDRGVSIGGGSAGGGSVGGGSAGDTSAGDTSAGGGSAGGGSVGGGSAGDTSAGGGSVGAGSVGGGSRRGGSAGGGSVGGRSGGSSTGLGLALARALVEADGGRLELSRARPAVFTIFLPAARADDVVGVPRRSRGPR